MRRYGLPLVLLLGLVSTSALARQKGGEDETGEYIPA
jgi:hypothetical protein